MPACRRKKPLPDEIGHGGLEVFRIDARNGRQIGRKVIRQQCLQLADQLRELFQEKGKLIAQQWQKQDEEHHEDEDEGEQDCQRRPHPPHAQLFQPVTNRIQQIGHRHAGNEREKHAGEDIQKQAKNNEGNQPELDLTAKGHVWRSSVVPVRRNGFLPDMELNPASGQVQKKSAFRGIGPSRSHFCLMRQSL